MNKSLNDQIKWLNDIKLTLDSVSRESFDLPEILVKKISKLSESLSNILENKNEINTNDVNLSLENSQIVLDEIHLTYLLYTEKELNENKWLKEILENIKKEIEAFKIRLNDIIDNISRSDEVHVEDKEDIDINLWKKKEELNHEEKIKLIKYIDNVDDLINFYENLKIKFPSYINNLKKEWNREEWKELFEKFV